MSDPPSRASPLVGAVLIRERTPERLIATFTVDPTEPVLAGHFPGFAILPGVCLVDCAHQAALGGIDDPCVVLAAVERARFLAPVYPGDRLRIEVSLTTVEGGGWRCTARIVVRRAGGGHEQEAAAVRLRYRRGEPAGAGR